MQLHSFNIHVTRVTLHHLHTTIHSVQSTGHIRVKGDKGITDTGEDYQRLQEGIFPMQVEMQGVKWKKNTE